MHKISYISDGQTIEYTFDFHFFQDRDVRVAINDNLQDTTQYAIYSNPSQNGGTITLSSPPEQGTRIDIFRQIVLSRTVDYQPTAKIDPENLNSDFNFILEAFRDLKAIDIDLAEWKNKHDNIKTFLEYAIGLIEDKLSGGSVLGIYRNLLSVLDGALPKLINDYGSVTQPADNENRDDYGIL